MSAALIAEMRRLRALRETATRPNRLIDQAIAVQVTAEAGCSQRIISPRVCPKCGWRGFADRCFTCTDETRLRMEVPCPNCYGGHFKPCQWCGDSGVALVDVPPNAPRSATGPVKGDHE